MSLSKSVWCLAVVGRCAGTMIVAENSRFGEFKFPVGAREFPVSAATGIYWQGLDLTCRF